MLSGRSRFGIRAAIVVAGAALATADPALAGIMEFFDDRPGWEAVVGDYTTIDFTGFEPGTRITTQYSGLGITFTDGFYTIFPENHATFPNDGWGLDGNGDITVVFDEPQSWIGAAFPGGLWYELYREGELVYTSSMFVPTGPGHFFGLVFPEQFDRVVLMEFGEVAIDDLLFGAPVPAPPVLALIGVGMLGWRRRARE